MHIILHIPYMYIVYAHCTYHVHVCVQTYMYMYIHILQVLSCSVSKALTLLGGSEASETAEFCDVFDKFFDALNVSNFTNGKHHRKPFQNPYRSGTDFRLKVCSCSS